MLAVDPDMDEDAMTEAMTEPSAGCVPPRSPTPPAIPTLAALLFSRETTWLVLEHQLFGTDQDLDALLNKLAQSEEMQDAEFISVFYGEDVNEEQAQKAADPITAACPNAEVSLLPGGQPVYYYMISAE